MYKLFSGTANQGLTSKVAKFLKLDLAKSEVIRFGNSEVKVTIKEDVNDQKCIIIQPTSNPTDAHLMELFFFCDALKRQEAKQVIGIIPYFGYAKQNIQHRPGESVSVNVVIRFLQTVGFDEIWTFDLHDEATEGVFSIPFKNLSALPLLAGKIKKFLGSAKDVAIVSPDQGGVERARRFAEHFFNHKKTTIVVVEKKRDQNIPHKAEPVGFYGDVKNKTAVIVDDMVVSGSTLLPAIDLCLQKGAKKIYAAIVHHDFSNEAAQKIQNSKIERFFTTDTIKLQSDQKIKKIDEISVAEIIAKNLAS